MGAFPRPNLLRKPETFCGGTCFLLRRVGNLDLHEEGAMERKSQGWALVG
jgi:hypothetical protein